MGQRGTWSEEAWQPTPPCLPCPGLRSLPEPSDLRDTFPQMQGKSGKERVRPEKQWPLPPGGTWDMLQGTKHRAGGLFVWSTRCARDPTGQWPCPCEPGWPPSPRACLQQPPWRRPGPRPSEPPHKEMFVPRRGLWAAAPLAPSSPSSFLLPAQATTQTGPD